jgi:hypothetical protein
MITHKDTAHWSNASGKSIQAFVEDLQNEGFNIVDIKFYEGETKAFVMTQTELWTPAGGDSDYE